VPLVTQKSIGEQEGSARVGAASQPPHKASKDDVTKALTGNWRDEHLFLLKQSLAIFDDLAKRVQECDAKIEALLAPLQRHAVKLKASPKGKGKNNAGFDMRQAIANWAGVDLRASTVWASAS